MSRSTRKPTLWTLRKISTRTNLSMPRILTQTDTFHLMLIFCFRNHYTMLLSPWDGMCRPGLACADCAGRSGSIHYAESITLVFSWNGSFLSHMVIVHNYFISVSYLNFANGKSINLTHTLIFVRHMTSRVRKRKLYKYSTDMNSTKIQPLLTMNVPKKTQWKLIVTYNECT